MDGDLTATTAYYSEAAEPFAENYQKNPCFRDRRDLFLRAVKEITPAGGKVLDFGCGPGVIALGMAKLGFQVVGFDGAAGMVKLARERAAALGLVNASFGHMDVSNFDPVVGPFDTVVCSSVIEYIDDDTGLLKRLVAALRPEGHLLVSVPHGANIFAPIEPLAHAVKLRLTGQRKGHLEHVHHVYSGDEFQARLQAMGLRDLKRTSFECPVFGSVGVRLSRNPFFARMLLFQGRKASASP